MKRLRKSGEKKVDDGSCWEKGDVLPFVPAERPGDVSALAIKTAGTRTGNRPRCSNCNKMGHTQDKCWNLHGKPSDTRPKKAPQPYGRGLAAVAEESPPSSNTVQVAQNQAQLEQFLSLLKAQTEGSTQADTNSHQGTLILWKPHLRS